MDKPMTAGEFFDQLAEFGLCKPLQFGPEVAGMMLWTAEKYASYREQEIVERVIKFLLDNGYCDDDVWCEQPTASERFWKEQGNK